MNQVTIYTKTNCIQCKMTKQALTRAGITFKEIDILKDISMLHKLKKEGLTQLPYVVTTDQHWNGFQPDKIKVLGFKPRKEL
ncbi:glutaredoxin-like protein NrdH [Fructilactobacillus sanfranciscensis]|uniref:glutaredoxin-like protein NrdH n=1 Tax=Fructilactobacillus sanfranciscensis TaxID=1625 RepID=UPI000A984696|nr:glutaredoxin-like protein NrdH [Fructilactobacillus sanfranciscensis]